MRTGLRGHVVCESAAHSDLDPLKGVKHLQPETAVEHVEVEKLVESRPWLEQVAVPVPLEWNRAGREPEVAEVSKIADCPGRVGYLQSSLDPARHELFVRERGFGIRLGTPLSSTPSHESVTPR